jgi:peptidoglycan hydrolase-like protein with peptidoglycan-binding domain
VNLLLPLFLFAMSKRDDARASAAPKWPGKRHPPPRHVLHPHVAPPVPPPVPPPPPLDAAAHTTPLHAVEPREILVADAQRIAITLGQSLKPDGLFGPKTAGAWGALAAQHGLDPSFTRLGPRTAQVSATTYDTLRAQAQNPKAAAKAQAGKLLKKFGGGIFGTPDGDVYIP